MKIIFVFFCLGFLFGCTDTPTGSTGEQASTPPTATDSSLGSTLPYEFKFDTIAYMSCSNKTGGVTHPRGTFFTFKVGAYNPGAGLKLSSNFLEATRGQSFFRQKNSFQSSYRGNNKAQWTLQLGVRGSNFANFGSLLRLDSTYSGPEVDYNIFLQDAYGSETVLTQLLNLATVSDDPYMRYQKGRSDLNTYRYFEQSLGQVGLSSENLRKLKSNDYRLSTFYTYYQNYVQSNPNVINEFRGRSFQLDFQIVGGAQDQRKLSSISEHIVSSANTVQDSSNWQCDSYQVMRDQDRNDCNTLSAAADRSSQPALKKAMENIWSSTGFWKFNHTKKCAVYQLNETITDRLLRDSYNVCYNETKLLRAAITERSDHSEVCLGKHLKNQTGYDTCYSEVFSNQDRWNAYCEKTHSEEGGARNTCKNNYNSHSRRGLQNGGGVAYQGALAPSSGSVSCDSANPSGSPSCPHFLSACWRQ